MNFEWFYSSNAPYVQPYGVPHIIYLITCFVTIFLFIRAYKDVKKHSNTIRKFFLYTLAFQQIVLLYGYYLFATGFDLSVSLPLHICRVSSIFTIFFLIFENKKLLDIIFYFGIYALVSFFYPMNVYHFAHISGFSYMINHLVTVIMPIFAFIAYGWKPTWKGCKKACIAFTIYFITVLILNPIIDGANYFYLMDRPFWHSAPYWLFSLVAYITTISGFALATILFQLGEKAVANQVANKLSFMGKAVQNKISK